MINAVREFEPKQAAGILARLALSLDTPAEEHVSNDIERQILSELRDVLHLAPGDTSPDAIERLAEALDGEAARVAGVEPDASTIDRLSQEGLLPSDTFEQITFDSQLPIRYGQKWTIEKTLAEMTVRNPHREQNFGPDPNYGCISLYARFFVHKFPYRSFWFLVPAHRNKATLWVGQVVRIYPHDIDLSQCAELIEVLHAFVNKFGVDIEFNGTNGRFFYSVDTAQAAVINDRIRLARLGKDEVGCLAVLNQVRPNTSSYDVIQLAFTMNFTKYLSSVEVKHGFDPDILSQLNSLA